MCIRDSVSTKTIDIEINAGRTHFLLLSRSDHTLCICSVIFKGLKVSVGVRSATLVGSVELAMYDSILLCSTYIYSVLFNNVSNVSWFRSSTTSVASSE